MQDPGEDLRDRPLGELLKQLSQQTATLVRQELDLAKAELTDRAKKAGAGAGLVGAAGVVGLACLGAFTAFVILLLDLALPAWAAALIVSAVYGVIAAVLGLRGRDKVKQASPPAPVTVETVKEDVQWAKTQTRSAKR
jgi:Putative Actinobacterial Holin-X, holin superfamily III